MNWVIFMLALLLNAPNAFAYGLDEFALKHVVAAFPPDAPGVVVDPVYQLMLREKYDTQDVKFLSDKIKQYATIDLSKAFTREEIMTYPSFSGLLKEDAKAQRKVTLQRWVIKQYKELVYITFFNIQLQKLLSEKLPLRLSYEAAEGICHKLAAQLKTKFDIEQGDSGQPNTDYWQIRLKGGGTDRQLGCESAVGLPQDTDDESSYLREMLKDKFREYKLAQHLVAMVLTVDATRVSDTQVKLTTSIDWPAFFKNYKFKANSELVEK